jgi:hypothetical protein
MTKYAGIDSSAALGLADKLDAASTEAAGMRTAIGNLNASASGAYNLAGWGDQHFDDSDRATLQDIASKGAPIAKDIRLRVEHLLGCQTSGLNIDTTVVFDDSAPPDPAKVKAALDAFKQHIGDPGFLGIDVPAIELLNVVQGLNPTEQDAFIRSLSPDQLKQLEGVLSQADPKLRAAYADVLLPNIGADTLGILRQNVPCLQPPADTSYEKNVQFAAVNGSLFGPDGSINLKQDLHQGDDGDCWFLASLGTLAQHDPKFVQDHIKQNPNGTYTVTFYKDGKPFPVTVDGQLPTGTRKDGSTYTAYTQTPNGVLWPAIYEKAYAQFNGGYSQIDGGFGDRGLRDLTGRDTEKVSAGGMSADDFAKCLKDGAVMTAGSADDSFLWWSGDEFKDVEGQRIVTSHEYVVQGVDANAHPPTITLVNPWGDDSGTGLAWDPQKSKNDVNQTVTLTIDDFQKYFDVVSIGSIR